jgi:hypothetical protein
MRFEKLWVQQYQATKTIKRRFGAKSALDYLIREKLIAFADDAERYPEFAKELPRFLAAVWQVFNQYELTGYIASQKPAKREQLRRLLFVKCYATARAGSLDASAGTDESGRLILHSVENRLNAIASTTKAH